MENISFTFITLARTHIMRITLHMVYVYQDEHITRARLFNTQQSAPTTTQKTRLIRIYFQFPLRLADDRRVSSFWSITHSRILSQRPHAIPFLYRTSELYAQRGPIQKLDKKHIYF